MHGEADPEVTTAEPILDQIRIAALRAKRRRLDRERNPEAAPEQHLPPFPEFLHDWRFRNRETGQTMAFDTLWEGQQAFVDLMLGHAWVYALKAGKLGFTELECAWDAYRALSQRNALVALLSKDQVASRALMGYVTFGITRLPPEYGIRLVTQNLDGIAFRVNDDPDDVRTIRSFPATSSIAIDLSLTHAHVDELSQVQDGEGLWNSVNTTISPSGTCHVLTRGRGEGVYSATLWRNAKLAPEEMRGRHGFLFPFFVDWTKRPLTPERDKSLLAESGNYTSTGLSYFLPDSEEDALAGDSEEIYITPQSWARCYDPNMPELTRVEPCVIGIDAAVRDDCFAVVVASRHPANIERPAIRLVRTWRPSRGHPIDMRQPERFIRWLAEGGCANEHPRSMPLIGDHELDGSPIEDCLLCVNHQHDVGPYNVLEIAYDPTQLEGMIQGFQRDGIWGTSRFDQGKDRLIADAGMRRLAMRVELAHNGDPVLAEHVTKAKAKVSPDEDRTLRIIKSAPDQKIDAAVAASMAVARAMKLNV